MPVLQWPLHRKTYQTCHTHAEDAVQNNTGHTHQNIIGSE